MSQFRRAVVLRSWPTPISSGNLSILIGCLSGLDEFKKEKIEEALRNLAGEMGTKPTPLIHLVRLAATGTTVGLPLFDLLELIGKDEAHRRGSQPRNNRVGRGARPPDSKVTG